jgi:DNA adenine methylase
MDVVKPVLKWVGGKTQIIETILEQFPKEMNNYREPFVGGGSVLLGFLCLVQEGVIKVNGGVYASDKNEKLIALYKNIQQHPQEVINELKVIVDVNSTLPFWEDKENKPNRKPSSLEEAQQCQESYYYWIRSLYNSLTGDEKPTCKATAYFIFLNKTCFRGVYREGPKGFNVPYGHYKNPGIYDDDHIMRVSNLLKHVVLTHQSFETSLEQVQEGDFVYLDPPYAPENDKSFVGYTSDGFNEQMHIRLFGMCASLRNITDVKFMMSNADVGLVRNNFLNDVYNIQVIDCKRSINSKKPASKTKEVIIKWKC